MSDQKLLRIKPGIIKLSASAVGTYKQCPRKYYFNYIDKQPTKEWGHFDLGNLCHYALELFHKAYMKGYNGSLSKLMGQCFEKARPKYPNIGQENLAEAKKLLTIYLKSVTGNMPVVKSVEGSFSFNLSDDVMIRGYVDRLDVLDDATYHIVDYKTTKNTKYLKPFQLKVYGLWLKEKIDPSVTNFKASYVLLRHNSKLKEYEFNEKDLEDTKKELLEYASQLKNENTWNTIPTRLCGWCDFENVCPANETW